MGLDGFTEIFPRLRRGRRARATIRIGQPFGPFMSTKRARRDRLEAIGHEIMDRISALIPPERRGHYSTDPAIRAAAEGTEVYPWASIPEN
jgi:hypothetical protein